MKTKPLILSLAIGLALGGTFATVVAVKGVETTTLYGADAVGTSRVIEVTSLPYSSTYSKSLKNYTTQYLPAPLSRPGSYFRIINTFSSTQVNVDGHLLVLQAGNQYDYLEIGIDAPSADRMVYATEADCLADNPLNVVGLSDLRQIDVQIGEGNEIALSKSDTGNSRFIEYAYNEATKTHSYSGSFTSLFAAFAFYMPSLAGGQKLVIDKITLTYNC